jgi:hypothetical protein
MAFHRFLVLESALSRGPKSPRAENMFVRTIAKSTVGIRRVDSYAGKYHLGLYVILRFLC